MRAWKLPQWSFSIWDGCGQHRMIPVVQTCPLSHVVHVHFVVVFLVFGRLWPCLVMFLWQVCCVWLYDRTIGVVAVLLWPKAVLVVVRLRWWLALLIYLLYGLCKKFSGSFWKISSQMLLFFFWTRLSGSSFRIRMSALTQPGLYRVVSLLPFWCCCCSISSSVLLSLMLPGLSVCVFPLWSRPLRKWSTRGIWMIFLLRGVLHSLI